MNQTRSTRTIVWNAMIICTVVMGLLVGIVIEHYYPFLTAWLFR